jgi:hypothetical protein
MEWRIQRHIVTIFICVPDLEEESPELSSSVLKNGRSAIEGQQLTQEGEPCGGEDAL